MIHVPCGACALVVALVVLPGCSELRYVKHCVRPLHHAYHSMTCSHGCVPVAFGEPTQCCEPCDHYGNWVGCCDGCAAGEAAAVRDLGGPGCSNCTSMSWNEPTAMHVADADIAPVQRPAVRTAGRVEFPRW